MLGHFGEYCISQFIESCRATPEIQVFIDFDVIFFIKNEKYLAKPYPSISAKIVEATAPCGVSRVKCPPVEAFS
jgi:hypothetical protein